MFNGLKRGWERGAFEYGMGQLPKKQPNRDVDIPLDMEDDKDQLILEMAGQLEALQAELGNLMASKVSGSGDVETLAEVFRLPGFKKLLLNRYHQDSNPKATAADKIALTEAMQKINAAYEVVESLS